MVTKEQYTEEKCIFCASDYHLELILLPYIKEKIDKNKIIIFTEKSLEESINVLLTKVNMNEKDKKKIRDLNWKNTDEIEFKAINNGINNTEIDLLKGGKFDTNLKSEDKKIIIIVNGSFKYIKNIKCKLNSIIGKNTEIVDCFHIEDPEVNISNLLQKYGNTLNTKKI